MNYDSKLWNEYTDDNEKVVQPELSKFIYYISIGLGAKNICECGCNVGNNLSSFPDNSDVYGVDLNAYALEKAKKSSLPFISSKQTSIVQAFQIPPLI
jgi:hypothetical protein